MKRWFVSLILITAALGMTVYAAEEQQETQQEILTDTMTEITVEEADISIQIPDSCYILKQDIAEDDAYLAKMGADKEKIEAYFKEAGIVLNAIAQDNTYEIVVTVNQNQDVNYIYNMQSLPDEQIAEFAKTIQQTYEGYGYTVQDYMIYEAENASYVLLDFGQTYEESSVMCRQYYTIRDSKIYNFTLRSYLGEVTPEMSEMMQSVIESIQYLQEMDHVCYENKEAGVSFELPEGWTKINDMQDSTQTMGVQYMHANGLGESIQFVCVDIWGNMDVLHQLTNTREDIQLQKDGVSRTLKGYVSGFFENLSDTYQISYQKINYLVSDTPAIITSENMQGEYRQRNVVTVQNGILYAYQYGYYADGNLHEKDFDFMLGSIAYEEPRLLLQDEEHYQNVANMTYRVMTVAVLVIVLLAFAIILYVKGSVQAENNK